MKPAIAGLVLCAPFLPAQPLTVDDCIRRALAVSSPVTVARQERDIAARGVTAARSGFLPQSAVNLATTYNSPSLLNRSTFSFVALNGIREYSGLVAILQEIDTSGRVRAEYARSKAAQDAALAGVALAERDLKRAVVASYYRLLLARHLSAAFDALVTESESFEQRTRLLAQQGEAAQADVVKASAQTLNLRQARQAAGLAADLANQDLASYWTADVQQPLDIVDLFDQPLPAPEPAAADAAPYLRRFEFRIFDAQQRALQADTKVARSALLPKLGLAFEYGLDENTVAWNRRGYAAIASLNLTVFDWFRSLSAVRQAQSRVQQNQATRAIAERAFSREYQSALTRVRRVFEQVDLARRQVELAEQDVKLSRVRYEGGEGAAVDVVVSQNQLASARSSYYSAIADYFTARWELEVAAGR